MRRRALAAFVVALLTVVISARPSGGLFHLAVLDEVMTSYNGDPNVQFVEVRMLSALQNFVKDSVFAAFDDTGAYVADILVVPANVANSGNGTRWIIGTSDFATASGLTPDFTMPAGILPTGGGMVCFGGGGGIAPAAPGSWSRTNFANYVDCVAYGSYAGSSNALIGTPTPLDGDGHSLQRTTSTNNNAADFSCGDPATPTNNLAATASLPATTPCSAGPCPAAPDLGCAGGFAKSFLLYKESPAGKEKLVAKFIGGPALAQTDLGNPLSNGGTSYGVCIYSDAGALVGEMAVDRAGDTCAGVPCWNAIGADPPAGKGYKYKDGAVTADGIAQILFKGGAAGKSKAIIKGKGPGLPGGVAAALQGSLNATVQLRGSNAAQCLSITVSDVKKSESDFFKAK